MYICAVTRRNGLTIPETIDKLFPRYGSVQKRLSYKFRWNKWM